MLIADCCEIISSIGSLVKKHREEMNNVGLCVARELANVIEKKHSMEERMAGYSHGR